MRKYSGDSHKLVNKCLSTLYTFVSLGLAILITVTISKSQHFMGSWYSSLTSKNTTTRRAALPLRLKVPSLMYSGPRQLSLDHSQIKTDIINPREKNPFFCILLQKQVFLELWGFTRTQQHQQKICFFFKKKRKKIIILFDTVWSCFHFTSLLKQRS